MKKKASAVVPVPQVCRLAVLMAPLVTGAPHLAFSQAESFEREGEPYELRISSDKLGDGPLEVVLDDEGVEILWRVYYHFHAKMAAGADTDGDGVSDAEEAEQWTNPLKAESLPASETSYERRRKAIESFRTEPLMLDGKPASPADELAYKEAAQAGFRERLAREAAEREKRIEAWMKRTGGSRYHTGVRGSSPSLVIDVRDGRIIRAVAEGYDSNTMSNIAPLWPYDANWPGSGSVGSNVTGAAGSPLVRKICGVWDVGIPRILHQELAGRVFNMDGSTFDASESHPTAVAGIVAATGYNYSNFRGVAYQSRIDAYSANNNYYELAVLTLDKIKDMRASNHSYTTELNGWKSIEIDDVRWLEWGGDIGIDYHEDNDNDIRIYEDAHFGRYSDMSVTADQIAYGKDYHLIIKSSGNEHEESAVFQKTKKGSKIVYMQGPSGSYGTGEYFFTHYYGIDGWFSGSSNKFIPSSAMKDIVYNGSHGVGTVENEWAVLHLPDVNIINDGMANGYDSLNGGFSTAKNVLLVGALNYAESVAQYSSRGPTDDRRIKPDVVALGGDGEDGSKVDVLGAGSSTDYSGKGYGTSYASPVAAGAVTLLSEYQEKLRGPKEPLRASTFRALLCHTADDLGFPGPDYEYGWGKVDAEKAAQIIKANNERLNIAEVYIPDGGFAHYGYFASGGEDVKVTIAWNDPPGEAQSATALDPQLSVTGKKILVNDMELRLSHDGPGGGKVTVFPWAPNPVYPDAASGTGINARDNVEQCIVSSLPANEPVLLDIRQRAGTTLSGGGQWVSVITSGIKRHPGYPGYFYIVSISYFRPTPTQLGANITFRSQMGEYYKIQVAPYNAPSGVWFDMSPVLYARFPVTTITSNTTSIPSWYTGNLQWRVVSVSPNPFNIP